MKESRAIRAGFHPFWFWNDCLEDDEIRRQIREMADKGARGFFIHPRQGLGQPYLSAAFFEKARAAIDEAKRLGLEVHLYDEFPYPSGTAGGLTVMGRPEFHATRLIQNKFDVKGGRIRIELPQGFVLEAKAFPIAGGKPNWNAGVDLLDSVGACLTQYTYIEGRSLSDHNNKRFWAGAPAPVIETKLPPGEWRIFASVQAEIRQFKYWGAKVDIYNKSAVRRFLELTHDRYFREFGDEFGGVVKSIFTDETTPEGWSRLIPEVFFDKYGYELTERLYVLQAPEHSDHARVRAEFERLKYELFIESWEKPYSDWCSEHGVAYSGEKEAVRFEQMKYMDIPGCDPGHTKAGDKPDVLGGTPRRNARTTASAAYFYDKPGALCECFHSVGWSATLQDVKLISDMLLLCGIRYLVPHGFFYSAYALRKHDAPPSVFFQTPYWPLFGRLTEHVERVADLFEGAWIDAEVLLVDNGEGIPNKADISANERIHEALMGGHIEYLVCDTALLRGGDIRDGRVHIKDIAARAVIVPPMRTPPPELEEWLKVFEEAGGEVIRLARDFDPAQLIETLRRVVAPALDFECDAGDADKLWITRRLSGNGRLWFLVNTGDGAVNINIKSDAPLVEAALNNSTDGFLAESENGFNREIASFESILLKTAASREPNKILPRISARIGGEAVVRPLNKNLLRLYDWRMSVVDSEGRASDPAPVRAIPLANQLAQSGLSFAPKINVNMNGETRLDIPPLRIRYERSFNRLYDGAVYLVMEPGGIVGDWTIAVNDNPPFGAESFAPTEAHTRGSLATEITDKLRDGENRLRVDVITDRSDGGLLNALYLAGNFGVELDPDKLTGFPERGAFEDYEANGLPHYAGVVEYDMDIELDAVPQSGNVMLDLEFDSSFREACEVSINGGEFMPVPWSPRSIKLPADSLNRGANEMTIRVYTSLIRSFEGEYYDALARRCRPVGEAKAKQPSCPATDAKKEGMTCR